MSFSSVIHDARQRLKEGGPRTSFGRKYTDVAEAAAEVATTAADRLGDLEQQQIAIDGMLRGTENLVEHARNIVVAAETNVHQQAETLHSEVTQLRTEMAQWRQQYTGMLEAMEQARADATVKLAQANSIIQGAQLFIQDRENRAQLVLNDAEATRTKLKEAKTK